MLWAFKNYLICQARSISLASDHSFVTTKTAKLFTCPGSGQRACEGLITHSSCNVNFWIQAGVCIYSPQLPTPAPWERKECFPQSLSLFSHLLSSWPEAYHASRTASDSSHTISCFSGLVFSEILAGLGQACFLVHLLIFFSQLDRYSRHTPKRSINNTFWSMSEIIKEGESWNNLSHATHDGTDPSTFTVHLMDSQISAISWGQVISEGIPSWLSMVTFWEKQYIPHYWKAHQCLGSTRLWWAFPFSFPPSLWPLGRQLPLLVTCLGLTVLLLC